MKAVEPYFQLGILPEVFTIADTLQAGFEPCEEPEEPVSILY